MNNEDKIKEKEDELTRLESYIKEQEKYIKEAEECLKESRQSPLVLHNLLETKMDLAKARRAYLRAKSEFKRQEKNKPIILSDKEIKRIRLAAFELGKVLSNRETKDDI